MPTVLTHPAVAALRTWFPRLPARVALAGALLSILPDADVAAFALDIPFFPLHCVRCAHRVG